MNNFQCKLLRGKQLRVKWKRSSDIDLLPDGKESWAYIFVKSTAKGVNYIPYVNLAYSGTNDTTKKLKILFNTNGVVEFFNFNTSQGETKNGLF